MPKIDRYEATITDRTGHEHRLRGWIVFLGPFVFTLARMNHDQ